jgi:hypothetical protein
MSTRPPDPGPPPRGSGQHEQRDGLQVSATRAVVWLVIAVVVLAGILLYFRYADRLNPVLG